MSKAGRGRLLVIDGPEGAGKSTQVARLGAYLEDRGIPHLELREPGGTPLGEEIRQLLLNHPSVEISAEAEALLFMASRAQLVAKVVSPACFEGRVVTLDRFFLSTYAYQVVGRDLDERQVVAANALATNDLVPDLTLLLVLPAEEGLKRADQRGQRDRMERSGDAFHWRVQGGFERFATPKWQLEHPEAGPIVTIDARGTPDEVEMVIRDVLNQRWPDIFSD